MAIIQNLIKRVEELERAVAEIREALASRAPAHSKRRKKDEEADDLGS